VYLDDVSLVEASASTVPAAAKPVVISTPAPAEPASAPVAASEWPKSGSLLGIHGKAFALFPLIVTTADQVALILHILPYDMIIANATGLTLYGPNGMAVSASKMGALNQMQVTCTPVVGTEYLVQVYNYLSGFPISFSLTK
jgi:hypothetical protein